MLSENRFSGTCMDPEGPHRACDAIDIARRMEAAIAKCGVADPVKKGIIKLLCYQISIQLCVTVPDYGAKTCPIAMLHDQDVLKSYKNFKKFDTVVDHSDHLFSTSPMGKASVNHHIFGDWKILEEELPGSRFERRPFVQPTCISRFWALCGCRILFVTTQREHPDKITKNNDLYHEQAPQDMFFEFWVYGYLILESAYNL
ncbi:hypothetical protein L1987_55128 [Smallanthus sonchifolius]|uniref:Uncharacterized protein n=1 Tax=Smallanthus sonchifolius TaxID=185202 RepID=A0ACB9E9F0_9ASTR|nr:hypothetical protein L1987_55128 [Smallanthus sonchifolius]